jgi:ATP-dependent DNA helicase Q1
LFLGYIKEDFHFTPYSTISYLVPGRRQLTTKLKIKIPKFEAKASKNKDSSLKVTQKPANCQESHLDVKRKSISKSLKEQPSNGHSPKKNSSKEQSSKEQSVKKQPSKEQPTKCINKEEGEDSDEDFLPPVSKKSKVSKSIIIDSDSE